MAPATFFVFFFLLHLLFSPADSRCPPRFDCGEFGPLEFPLTDHTQPECGLFMVNCANQSSPRIQLADNATRYDILKRLSPNKFRMRSSSLQQLVGNRSCLTFGTLALTLPDPVLTPFSITPNLTVVSCELSTSNIETVNSRFGSYRNYTSCQGTAYFMVYYQYPPVDSDHSVPDGCYARTMPRNETASDYNDIFDLLNADFDFEWSVSDDCRSCHRNGGHCLSTRDGFYCRQGRSRRKLILAIALSGAALFLMICVIIAFIIYRRKKILKRSYLLSRNISSSPSSRSDLEGKSFYYGIHIFSYGELEEATNNFDSTKELGDGGFGTVYHGKLRDGREVAIKRLYEHNCKRVEQFMNEIRILTCLKHPNLVILYGCTSRRSRELLLVYEYIPNGTVADHLHGEKASDAPLSWAVRMNIAIETASALAYLHKSDIVHRDVKTNNILLDDNFCVKVADFGLSRLFPNDVTHVSTAPQGTPGYVDPEYHQCYQLTEKSDVYSFGVVLIELISSLPAVDISRHRHEINLANLAVNRIQRCAFDELIDFSLGYKSDPEVTRMTTSVAEVAFRCLQLDKDSRPTMYEVLDFLKDIQGGGKMMDSDKIKEVDGKIPPSPETDEVMLLKNKNYQSSPTAVTDIWVSGSSTTTTSSIG